jgi:hypothetical protein
MRGRCRAVGRRFRRAPRRRLCPTRSSCLNLIEQGATDHLLVNTCLRAVPILPYCRIDSSSTVACMISARIGSSRQLSSHKAKKLARQLGIGRTVANRDVLSSCVYRSFWEIGRCQTGTANAMLRQPTTGAPHVVIRTPPFEPAKGLRLSSSAQPIE